MLYLQQGKCFFCGEKLALADANIEHLHPLSLGGKRTEDNEVVCHKSLNDTYGNLPLKQKFEFVLKAAGSFRCPKW
jgi:5-methylcytosine-specific restriction endonuclease McrA